MEKKSPSTGSLTDDTPESPQYLRKRYIPDLTHDHDFLMEHLNDLNYDLLLPRRATAQTTAFESDHKNFPTTASTDNFNRPLDIDVELQEHNELSFADRHHLGISAVDFNEYVHFFNLLRRLLMH
jgi:hypothetical protein